MSASLPGFTVLVHLVTWVYVDCSKTGVTNRFLVASQIVRESRIFLAVFTVILSLMHVWVSVFFQAAEVSNIQIHQITHLHVKHVLYRPPNDRKVNSH